MDQHIREKLQEREIQPSASAWERLASQLDDAESKKKRHWFFYVGYAASILLLISLIFVMSKDDENKSPIPENVIVNDDTSKPKIDKTKEFISVPEKEVLVNNDNLEQKPELIKDETNQIKKKELKKSPVVKFNSDKSSVAENTKKNAPKIDVQKKIKELTEEKDIVIVDNTFDTKKPAIRNSRISVDSDALLMSVTSTKEELRVYYKKYKIDRAEVLLAIQKELKKSNVKVDPETILAEVELDVNEENFQNNFYKFIKKRVSTVATAIANRNN